MKARKLAVSTAILAVATTGLIAPSASANPSGCGMYNTLAYNSTSDLLTSKTVGDCATSASRTVYAEIKQDKPFATDPLVAKASGRSTGYQHKKSVSSCDDGETHTYYGRGYYSTTPSDHHDSSTQTVRSCG